MIDEVLWVFDVVILGLFCLEVMLKTFAFGKIYVSDPWNVVDMVVVGVCVIFTIVEVLLPDDGSLEALFSIRLILRMLRVVVVGRKLSKSTIAVSAIRSQQRINMEAPVDKLILLLSDLKRNPRLRREIRDEIKDSITIIQSGRLYDTVLQSNQDDLEGEATAWLTVHAFIYFSTCFNFVLCSYQVKVIELIDSMTENIFCKISPLSAFCYSQQLLCVLL